MADPQQQSFDVDAARKAGYSDDEILQHLTQSRKFDVNGALSSGYSKQDIINHLSGAPSTSPTPESVAALTDKFNNNKPNSNIGTASAWSPSLMDIVRMGPKAYLQKRVEQLQQSAQDEKNQALGPESQGKSFISRLGHSTASLLPETAAVLDKVVLGLLDPKTAVGLVASKVSPAAAAAYFTAQGVQAAGDAAGKPSGERFTPENVQDFLLGLSQAAGGTASGLAAKPGVDLKDVAQKTTQRLVGAGPDATTVPIVKKFNEQYETAKAGQAAEDTKTAVANEKATDKGFVKAGEQNVAYDKAVREQATQHAKNIAQVNQHNTEVAQLAQQRQQLSTKMAGDSKGIGESISNLDKAVREEANQKYTSVRQATANDPGVPASDVAADVKAAEQKFIKGSPENIKQFRDILKRGESDGEVTIDGRSFTPATDPVGWKRMQEQGIVPETGNMTFADLQGFRSELASKLASGKLEGDVYQAMKSVHEALGKRMAEIADRNGVGPQLKTADNFYRQYNQVFQEKPSAVAETRERVGQLDPQYYSEPFVKGKAAQTGINALREFPSEVPENKAEASRIADVLESHRNDAASLKQLAKDNRKAKPMPEPPAPIEKPKPVAVETSVPKQIEQPAVPTAQDIMDAKGAKVQAKSNELSGLRRYDLMMLAGSAIAPFMARWETALVGPAAVGIEKTLASSLSRPKVVEWLSKPRPEDLAALDKLPPEVRDGVREDMSKFVRQEQAKGTPVTVAPVVQKFLLATPKTSSRDRLLQQGTAMTQQ